MQTVQAFTTQATKVKKVTGYELTTALIRGGLGLLKLSASTGQVLLYLATCYNGKPVFPRIKTIADNMGLSERTVSRAINELLENNCILKSKKARNINTYQFTNKIMSLVNMADDTRQNDTLEPDKMSLPYIEVKQHEVKPITNKKNVVSFFKISLDDIPASIRNNEAIKNKIGYWLSLDDNAKESYKQKDKEAEAKKEAEQNRKREQAEYLQSLRDMKNEKPMTETITRQEAIKILQNMAKVQNGVLLSGVMPKQLIAKFNIEMAEIV